MYRLQQSAKVVFGQKGQETPGEMAWNGGEAGETLTLRDEGEDLVKEKSERMFWEVLGPMCLDC